MKATETTIIVDIIKCKFRRISFFFMVLNLQKNLVLNQCPSPDSNGNTFVPGFGTKDGMDSGISF